MPKHYAQGINIQQGRVQFKNTSRMKIYYSLAFAKIPFVKISPEETENLPKYRIVARKTYFYLRFQSPYTGIIIWEATA